MLEVKKEFSMKKKILILGSVPVLVDIVKDAKKMGLYVIVTDNVKGSICKKYADEGWDLSIDDVDGIVSKCLDNKVDAVMNYCLDPGQKPYQQICEKLNLPCVDGFEQFEILTNKDKFAEACKKYNVGTIKEYDLNKRNEIEYPILIKPVDSRASKGIIICESEEKLDECIKYSLQFSKRKILRAEKYMIGCPEVCAKYFAVDGEYFFTTMADVYTCYTKEGLRVYLGTQTYPSKYLQQYLATTHDKIKAMLKGIGVKNGAVSFTGFYDNGIFRFFDPSHRMGGAQDWKIAEASSGIDISKELTKFSIGKKLNKEEIKLIDLAFSKKQSALLYIDLLVGKIAKIEGVEECLKLKGVVGHHQNHYPGDVIDTLGTANNVAIRFILSCDSKKEFLQIATIINNTIKITDSKGRNLVAPVFNPNLIL